MYRTIYLIVMLLIPTWAFAAGGSVEYTVNGQPYEGYYVSPSANAPLVLLIHDWDGLTDYEIKRAEMLAELGYAVFAADLYGKGVRPTEIADKRMQTGQLYRNRPKMRTLMNGALTKAKALGANTDNAVAMGYCFGGTAVLELARSGADLKAFVPFHGGLETPEGQDYSTTKGFILVFHGSADASVSMEQFATLTNELEAAGVRHEMITYSGAPHAFSVFGSERYRKDADQKSWTRFVRFLDETLR